MRYIQRTALTARTQRYLQEWTQQLEDVAALSLEPERTAQRATAARHRWRERVGTVTIREIRATLVQMNGRLDQRCMYCEYSMAGHIDHFEPIVLDPLRTFDWTNQLLGCDLCNSHFKRTRFTGPHGERPVDPTAEDPRPHLQMLPGGKAHALTPRGEWSIELFGLQRPLLVRLRKSAWDTLTSLIPQYAAHLANGEAERALAFQDAMLNHPFVSVLVELLAISRLPQGSVVIPEVCRRALASHPEIYGWV